MQYLHEAFTGGRGSVVTIEVDRQASVFLLDPPKYLAFKAGRQFRYHGGRMVKSPCHMSPSRSGIWHVVVQPEPGTRTRVAINVCAA